MLDFCCQATVINYVEVAEITLLLFIQTRYWTRYMSTEIMFISNNTKLSQTQAYYILSLPGYFSCLCNSIVSDVSARRNLKAVPHMHQYWKSAHLCSSWIFWENQCKCKVISNRFPWPSSWIIGLSLNNGLHGFFYYECTGRPHAENLPGNEQITKALLYSFNLEQLIFLNTQHSNIPRLQKFIQTSISIYNKCSSVIYKMKKVGYWQLYINCNKKNGTL